MPILRTALNFLLPPLCLSCRCVVGTPDGFCAECWRRLSRIDGSCCAQCGLPFAVPMLADEKCIPCASENPAYAQVRAAVVYDDLSRAMVLRLKHGDQTDLTPGLSRLMALHGVELLRQADIFIPVPLHYTRLIRRKYNQAALLAQKLARDFSIDSLKDYQPNLLRRLRPTPSQGQRKRADRFKNVKDAFGLKQGCENRIHGKNILLIDDVMTTGATLHECARVLLAGGAAQVNGLVIARVTLPQ